MNIYPSGSVIANRYEVVQGPAEKRSLVGGMGLVYLCMDRQEDRPVALKTFRPEFLPDRATRDRFLREGTTWVDLGKHPNIVRCYNIERVGDGREVYLSLELVAQEQGRRDASLRSWLTPGQPLPVEQSLLFALQIAHGMRHACEQIPGFVHRDLKPENLLIGADWLTSLDTNRLRITDFGLANILHASGVPTQVSDEAPLDSRPAFNRTQLTRGIVGTPLYMAPEQWLGKELGVYTDIYALGCILVEMLTGKFAVTGDSQQALQEAHCVGEVRELPSNIPAIVQNLIKKCVAMDSTARYWNWESLEAALVDVWKGFTRKQISSLEVNQELNREDRVAVGWSYNNIGSSYLDISKADVAKIFFERVRVIGQTEGDHRLEATGLGNLGLIYAENGDTRRAIEYYEQALEISRKIGDRDGEVNSLGNLGITYARLGNKALAIKYFKQQLEIAIEIGDRWGEGKALGGLGNVYTDFGDFQCAITYYEKQFEVNCKIGNRHGEGNALGSLGNRYADLGDAKRAINFLEQSLAIHREIGDRKGEGIDLDNLGSVYSDLGNAQRAINYLEQSLEIHREIKNPRGEGNVLSKLGRFYFQFGDSQRAINYLKLQLNIVREIRDREGERNALGNMGNIYLHLGDFQNAINYYKQALAICQEIGDILAVGMISENLGVLLDRSGQFDQAILLLKDAVQKLQKAGYAQQAQRTKELLVQLYSKKGF